MKIEVRTDTLDLNTRALFSFPAPFWKRVSKIAARSIIQNIKKQKQADGSELKKNKQSTLDRKKRQGRRLLSLVDDPASHRFVQTAFGSYEPKALIKSPGQRFYNGVRIGFTRDNALTVARYLQSRGYVGWFAVNQAGMTAIAIEYKKEIARALKRAVAESKKKKPR